MTRDAPTALLDQDAVPELPLNPVLDRSENLSSDATSLSMEPQSLLIEDPPKSENTEDTPASASTKKSKKDKKKKKKAAAQEEDVPIDNRQILADIAPPEVERLEAVPTVPADMDEDKNTESDVFEDAVAMQDQTVLQDDSTPKNEHPDPFESIAIDEHGRDRTTTPTQAGPQIESVEKDDKPNASWEDELLQEVVMEPAEPTTIDNVQPVEKDGLTEESATGPSNIHPASSQQDKPDEMKENESDPLAKGLQEEQSTVDSALTEAVISGESTEDQAQEPAIEHVNEEEPIVPVMPTKKSKKDKKKKKKNQDTEAPQETAAQDSAETPTGKSSSNTVTEPSTYEPTAAEPVATEPIVTETPVSEAALPETVVSEASASIETSSIEPDKKTKKEKKKKTLWDSLMGSFKADEPQEALPEDKAQGEVPQEQFGVKEVSRQVNESGENLPAEARSVPEHPQHELPTKLPSDEPSLDELDRRDLPQEDAPQEVLPATLDSGEAGEITLPQVETEVVPELPTVIESEQPHREEPVKDVPPSDDLPPSTPSKKSKKDKKKKKQDAILEAEPTPKEEAQQLEETRTLSVADDAPVVEPMRELDVPEADPLPDTKQEELADSPITKKIKKDKKKKKQALLETESAQDPIETPLDPISVEAPASDHQGGDVAPSVDIQTEAESSEGKQREIDEVPNREDDVRLQPQPTEEADVPRDALPEPSQSEEVVEPTASKKSKKKKKKRASEVELQPEIDTGSTLDAPKPEGSDSLDPPTEQSVAHGTENQDSISKELSGTSQEDVTAEPAAATEAAPSAMRNDAVDSNSELQLDDTHKPIVLDDATTQLSSQDQHPIPTADTEEPIEGSTAEVGLELGTDSLTLPQAPEATQPETTQPETTQPEEAQPQEAAPQVDDGNSTATTKKSKKDKKKKKRASQVSWELGPEAEIEDLSEKQQSEQAFDNSTTSESTKMGNSDDRVEDSSSEFASGKKSVDSDKHESQTGGEPVLDSTEAVEESTATHPSEQEQQYDTLLDHQSLAEDIETSLKNSTNLDDTFLETTSSKKSKKKKKASQVDRDAKPVTATASGSAMDPLPIEEDQTGKLAESVDALSHEVTDKVPEKEADVADISPEIIPSKQSKKDKRKAKKQPVIENVPEQDTVIAQAAENELIISDDTVGQPAATDDLIPVKDNSALLETPDVPGDRDTTQASSPGVSAVKMNSPLDHTQNSDKLSEDMSATYDPISSSTDDPQLPRDTAPPGGDSTILSNIPEEVSNNVPSKEQSGKHKMATQDSSQNPSQDPTDPSNEEPKEDEAPDVPNTDSTKTPMTNLLSWAWKWSNVDNVTQPETPDSKAVTITEDSSNAESPVTVRPSDVTRATSLPKHNEESNSDEGDNEKPTLNRTEPEVASQFAPESETHVARTNIQESMENKQESSQSDLDIVSTSEIPRAQHAESAKDDHIAKSSESASPEVGSMEPQDATELPSRKKSKKDKKDKKRAKGVDLKETSPGSQTPVVASSQDMEAPQPSIFDENAGSPQHASPQAPRKIPDAIDDRFPFPEPRPQSPLSNHQASTTIDMFPAQLSSHIEHDRPFDYPAQPDKKLRTHLAKNDNIVTTPPSAMDIEPLVADKMVIDFPSVYDETVRSKYKAQVSDRTLRESTKTRYEVDPMNVDDSQAPSDGIPSQSVDNARHANRVSIQSPSRETVEKKKSDVRETVKKTKEKKQSKKADNLASNAYDTTPRDIEKNDVPQDNHRLEAVVGDDFAIEPALQLKAQSDEVTSREVPELTQQTDVGTNDNNVESPVTGRGQVHALPVTEPSKAEEPHPQIKDISTTGRQDSWDNLDTSEPLEDDERPTHVGSRDAPEEPILLPLPPPRTPSALDFSRSLAPVEEETHEDLEEELRSDLQAQTPRDLEANRDSGFVTESPSQQRHGLDAKSNAVQRDSGVHMTMGTGDETAGSRERGLQGRTSPPDPSSHSQTPQPHERRSRRSLFDNETPQLDTPSPGRKWDRGDTPEKPTEDESLHPMKRATTTPLKATGAALNPRTPQLTQTPQTPLAQGAPLTQTPRSVSDNITNVSKRGTSTTPQPEGTGRRSVSNTGVSRLQMQTPEPHMYRTDSPGLHSMRSSHSIRSLRSLGANTPPLRRVARRTSGDLRSLSHTNTNTSHTSPNGSTPSLPISAIDKDKDKDKEKEKDGAGKAAAAAAAAAAARAATTTEGGAVSTSASDRHAPNNTITPIANEGRVRAKDMTDVYDGYGEGRIGSPRSPTRPPSMRRRQSMQVMELENKVEQLIAENRALAEARAHAERNLSQRNSSAITDRDAEIESLKASLRWLQNEVTRLTEVNEGLQSANSLLAMQHNEKYTRLESQHTTAARELDEHRGARTQFNQTLQAKDAEINELRGQLEAAKEHIREMKKQILATKPPDADFLRLKDEDHFDHRCQQLSSHVQQWVLRFSKFSDMRACRLTSEINDEKIIDRLDNTILDGSDVDNYLSDRVARRDIFMSLTMNMIWEFVFTRYLFGMDREQRQKLKSLEKLLTDVGPPHAVRQWRAITLTLLS
ncbi:hypothetical protein F4808DRAFT_430651, partial [Astrocystis sublimbata]